MLNAYQNVMKTIDLPPDARRRILCSLKAAKRPRRRLVPRAVLIAAVLALALGLTVGASTLVSFFSGGVNDGHLNAAQMKILVRSEDGRILLTTPDGELDITDRCSKTEPFIYEFKDESGAQHYIIAGGTPESCGFVEYIVDPETGYADGQGYLGGSSSEWRIEGERQLGIRP